MGHGRIHALSHLGAVHQHSDGVVRRDAQPSDWLSARVPQRSGSGTPGQGQTEHEATTHQSRGLQQFTTAEGEGLLHGRAPYWPDFMSSAARWMALRMRGYVPQRQRLPDMATSMSASVGEGLRASSAVADMI